MPVIKRGKRRLGGGAGRAWWLWEWLCEEVLRSDDGSGDWCQAEAQTPLRAMSEDQLKAFLEAVKADAVLQEKLNASVDADAVVVIAKAAGFVISAEELKTAQAGAEELSEEQLEGVAGSSGTNLTSCPVSQLGPPTCCGPAVSGCFG